MDESAATAEPDPPPDLTMYARLQRLYARDEDREFTDPRFPLILKMSLAGTLSGFMIGARIGGRVGGVEHIEHSSVVSHEQVHRSDTHAKRMYIDKMFMKGCKNGVKLGWRVGLVTGLYGTLAVLLCEKYPNSPGLCVLGAGTGTHL